MSGEGQQRRLHALTIWCSITHDEICQASLELGDNLFSSLLLGDVALNLDDTRQWSLPSDSSQYWL
jgi:hypothetical protein